LFEGCGFQLKIPTLFLACIFPAIIAGNINAAEYIGRDACKTCHAEQNRLWQGSHHDLAMQDATAETVLGDFNNTEFKQFDMVSRFFRKDSEFMVRTDGPDGKLADFPIKYTFGVHPLQQYLIEFPGGRLQALDIAWDSRSKQKGGQRWFHLHPEDKVTHDDVLHWTGPNLNWNYMCADCHSTNLKKNFDSKSGGYHTSWSEIDVSCEACHGPASEHKEWADTVAGGGEYKIADMGLTANLNERKGVSWLIDEKTGKPARSQPNQSRAEIQVCARCHSRRSQLTDDFTPGQPFMDAYHPSLLSEGLYFPDGQMRDEVYVWGSFRQSKMYHSGVTCSDCHDPHAADLKVPGEQVCYQCHAADRYASKEHHFHAPGSEGSSCVECHMSPTTFMGVDKRHDHSFRIPRPDLSVSMGTPNACNECHKDQSGDWAAQKVKDWYGKQPEGYQKFALPLVAARTNHPAAQQLLMQLALDGNQPGMARATAFSELDSPMNQQSMMLFQQGLNDTDPMVRLGALTAMESVPVRQRILAFPLVWDELRMLRIEAARLMAAYPRDQFKPEQIEVLDKVLQEYVRSQEFSAERPESQLNLAGLYTDMKQYDKAEAAFRQSLKLQPQFIPAYVNFAQMLSTRGREQEAGNLLNAGIRKLPDNATLHHVLGLSLVRQKKLEAALQSLKKAYELAPDNTRYAYVYAVALQSTGNVTQAIGVLEQVLIKNPTDLDILFGLVTFNRDAGNKDAALLYARKLQPLVPDNPAIEQLIQELGGQ
jgi:predicted CXXCH cytochrome family protein